MNVKKTLRGFAVVGALILTAVIVAALLPARTPVIKDGEGKVLPESIARIQKIEIGGVSQYLMIRGNDIGNPVLLFVHGGPGQAEIGYIREVQKELEERFVVVRWDQRGAGLSASDEVPAESLTTETLVSDADEITDYLIKTFGQPKIYIAGHSWGTVIATKAVYAHPEKYRAYIGAGQFVDAQKGEVLSYEYALAEARRQQNPEVLEQLKAIGTPPYSAEKFLIRAQCLSRLGCVFHTPPELNMGKALMLSSEYTLPAKLKYMKNGHLSAERLAPEILKVNFLGEIEELRVPVYFIMGKHDYFTPTALAEQFCDQLQAPSKELIVFEDSAHVPQLEEPGRFNRTLIRILEETGEPQ